MRSPHRAMKQRNLIIILSLFILLPNLAEAQRWKRFRKQALFGVGATNFLGELGGGNNLAQPGPLDLNLAATRPSLMIGYRYQLSNTFFFRSNLSWGILRGDDRYTDEPFRRGRNLRFRSGFLELSAITELYVLQNSRGSLYNLRGVRSRRSLEIDIYFFAGVGLMYFNPKGKFEDKWYPLQPLGTEGQGLPGEPKKYSRVTFTLPHGVGVGKTIDRFWQINVELNMRWTFTDYIDDVSTDYYGRDNLYQDKIANGASASEANRAAYLSDPNIYYRMPEIGISRDNQLVGEKRGNPNDNDYFFTGMITISRKIIKRNRIRPRF